MKRILPLMIAVAFFLNANAQENSKVIIGKTDTVYSKILGEQRKILVYVPNMQNANIDVTQRYPVVYLLDGDAHFESVVGMIQQLSQKNGNTVCPEMIVIGIPNTDRTRDLTPTHIVSDLPMMDSNFSRSTGGGETFAAFLEKELMPHVDSAYPTQPYKMLIGHSFGGLTAMNILINHTKLFNAYIAIDPSMWYDKERFLKTTEQKLTNQKYNGTRLYLGIANTMPDGMTVDKMLKDTSSTTRHIRSIFALDKFIKTHTQNGLKFSSKYYPDDDHGSVPLITEYDGLRFIFDYYRMKFTQADLTDTTAAIVAKYKKHYEIVSKEFGYKVSPPELFINSFGYQALATKQYSKAAALFEMNIENYPKSGNVYDSYGDYFSARKDTTNAVLYYQKALAINNNDDTNIKLQQMQGMAAPKLTAQDLLKYSGDYFFAEPNITAAISVKDGALIALVPGEGEMELIPVSLNTFTIKNLEGYKVHFETDGDKVVGITSYQPNGTFKATKKN